MVPEGILTKLSRAYDWTRESSGIGHGVTGTER